jgi:NitT/TauT family transport system permease protein
LAELAEVRPESRGYLSTHALVWAIRLFAILFVLLSYELFARSELVFPGIVPSLVDISKEIVGLFLQAEFYLHLAATCVAVFLGLLIGGSIGLFWGFLLALAKKTGDILQPIFLWIAPTPKIVFLPIIMLMFGLGLESKVAKASLAAFFPIFVASFAGAREVKPVYLSVMASLNASMTQKMRYVYIPAMSIVIIGSLRLSLGVTVVGTLLAEIKMSNMGLGYLIIQSYNFFRIPEMYALLAITFAVALSANLLLDRIGEKFKR